MCLYIASFMRLQLQGDLATSEISVGRWRAVSLVLGWGQLLGWVAELRLAVEAGLEACAP